MGIAAEVTDVNGIAPVKRHVTVYGNDIAGSCSIRKDIFHYHLLVFCILAAVKAKDELAVRSFLMENLAYPYKKGRNLLMILQWVLMPITSILYQSLAAFYSQTRLMLGLYMEKFDVTKKIVKK